MVVNFLSKWYRTLLITRLFCFHPLDSFICPMMFSNQEINDIIQWDVRSWKKALHFWEKNVLLDPGKKGLELGGREGGLSLFLACQGMQVTCSDLEMVEDKAAPLHRKYGVNGQIQYMDIDATNIPFENHFDVIVFKSIIGGIGRNGNKTIQKKVFEQIFKALKPGGLLLFAENLAGSPAHKFFRKKFVRWGNEWRYLTLDEIQEFLTPFADVKVMANGCLAAFGRSEFQRRTLSYIDDGLVNFIVPGNWKYIAMVSARKP